MGKAKGTAKTKAGSLYDVLKVHETATAAEIKKAYFSLCLQLHPDKNPDAEATVKFQALQKVYSILGDAEKRKVYDETGETDDEVLSGKSTWEDLTAYYRDLHQPVTTEALDAFYDSYRGSEEEQKDLLELYEKYEGNMQNVLASVMCSSEALDSHRFMDAIKAAMAEGEVRKFPRFTKWCKAVAATPAPSDPLKKRAGEGGKSQVESAAAQAIMKNMKKRAEDMNNFYDSLAIKYGGQAVAGKKQKPNAKEGKEKKGSLPPTEPTEEEFAAARARALYGKAKTESASDKTGGSKKEAAQGKENKRGVEEKAQKMEESEGESESSESCGEDSDGMEEEEEEEGGKQKSQSKVVAPVGKKKETRKVLAEASQPKGGVKKAGGKAVGDQKEEGKKKKGEGKQKAAVGTMKGKVEKKKGRGGGKGEGVKAGKKLEAVSTEVEKKVKSKR